MTEVIDVPIKMLTNGEGLPKPFYATDASAGMDLCAAVDDSMTLKPGERMLVPCGFSLGLPFGFEAQVRPRSGLAFKHGVTVLNAPGTIDADYRGEVKVLLVNHGPEPLTITRGMRVAQLVIAPVIQAQLDVVANLDETDRGDGGFGSTGTHG